jgi:hypothetical protein
VSATRLLGACRHDHAGGPQDEVAQPVALLRDLDDAAFLRVRWLREQGLVDVRVEAAVRLDLLEPLPLQQVGQRPVHERDALLELRLLVLLGRLERPLEVVDYGQQLLHEALRGPGGRQLLIPRDAFAVVVELRREPAQVVEVLVRPLLGGRDLGAEVVLDDLRCFGLFRDDVVLEVLRHEDVFASSSITS